MLSMGNLANLLLLTINFFLLFSSPKFRGTCAIFYSLNVNLLIDWAETKIKCSWDKEYIIMVEFESLHFLFLISQILILFLFFFLLIFIDSSSSECCVANRMINERQTWPTLTPQTFFPNASQKVFWFCETYKAYKAYKASSIIASWVLLYFDKAF